MAYYLGIDIGSGTSKGLVANEDKVISSYLLRSGVDYRLAAQVLRNKLLTQANLLWTDIAYTVSTGIGSAIVDYADNQMADILCCARGINSLFPNVHTVIDVEGQSTQVINLNLQGQITNFVNSEKCASGAGRFLEIIANVLQIPLEEIGPLSLKSKSPVNFTTGCAVFGESEAVSRVAEGVSKEDILAGVHKALANKILSLMEKVGIEPHFGICGGGALNNGLVQWVQQSLGTDLVIPQQPQLITALGAIVFAREMATTC
jgi:(R)-2-hydroxyacyl-CoA dehydratese activating ATPase